MNEQFVSEDYKKIFRKMSNVKGEGLDFYYDLMDVIPEIAKILNVGYCLIQADSTGIMKGEGNTERIVIGYDYKAGGAKILSIPERPRWVVGNEDDMLILKLDENSGSLFEIHASPYEGEKWSDEYKGELEFVFETIHVILGKTRASNTIERVRMLDMLTGLYNANGIEIEANKLLAEGKLHQYNTIFFNIKSFGYINQQVGPERANNILRAFGERLKEYVSMSGLAARVGGDNFVVVVRRPFTETLLGFLNGVPINAEYRNPATGMVYYDEFVISVRAGITRNSEGNPHGQNMGEATAAMKKAKSSQKEDYCWFKPEILEKVAQVEKLSMAITRALTNKEFVVYYQPKVSVENREVVGAEALVRWKKGGEIIMPDDFIPDLEKGNVICEVDHFVFEQVCKDIENWKRDGIEPVRISVNFSKLHLFEKSFAERILETMNNYGVDSKYIEIELTETASVEDYDRLYDFVSTMKSEKIKVSIDDFGTGYSSLNMLKDFNVDVVKLDKSFVDDLSDDNENNDVVVKNTINMINELDMESVVEGVESKDQLEFLQEAGVSVIQGFWFDEAMPREEYEKRLIDREKYYLTHTMVDQF
ncbi:MAG: GGDEF domain-containing phosphodiesterase [Eubacterium sp.]|nr:GGDEF domain-containing phosphodiesterase [Eubacterium sp.]